MLEFLKECDQFDIYNRAHDCEIALSARSSAVSFAVFFEITFKHIYAYFIHEDRYKSDPSLYELLHNDALTEKISAQYDFSDFETVNEIRKKSNLTKHDATSTPISDVEKKQYFQCVYAFCSKFYEYQTNKRAPLWNDNEYNKLTNLFANNQEREKRERDYSRKVSTLQAELETAHQYLFANSQEREKRERDYSQKVSTLQAELEAAHQSKKDAEVRALELQKQLDLSSGKNAPYFSTEHRDDTFEISTRQKPASVIRLSDNQKRAVECADKYIAVVAGPGSGKTRVLTERIRYLVEQKEVPENKILALSFSSKAANEVRKRLKDQMGIRACRIEAKTFHSFGLQLIRQHADLLGLTSDVEILDETGRFKVIRKVMTSLRHYNNSMPLSEIRLAAQKISNNKSGLDLGDSMTRSLTSAYNNELKYGNYIDFDDMVGLTRELLTQYPEIRSDYKRKYQHVLVDEVQDVNAYQIDIIKALVGAGTTLFVVGDDDQCIYEWRGAVPSFLKTISEKPEFTVIQLEDNYRSETSIVRASASFISRNANRIEKHIRARKMMRESVTSSTRAFWLGNEKREAAFIASTIKELVEKENYTYGDITILVRGHKQFPAIKAALLNNKIPCFCQEDMSRYDSFIPVLKAISNIEKQGNINRAVNFPTRIMDNFLYLELKEKYRLADDLTVLEMFDFLCTITDKFEYSELFRARYQLIKELSSKVKMLSVTEIIRRLIALYSNEDSHAKSDQMDDAYGILSLASEFDKGYSPSADDKASPLDEFLDYIMLVQEDDSEEENQDQSVNLMTCHRSKGLEFPVVFIAGVQCGTFPDDKYMVSVNAVEAERRLLYVSMTRAIDRLYITCNTDPYAGKQIYDKNGNLVFSFRGFLSDIPDIVLKDENQCGRA